jgi:hypothetical protein
MKVRKQKQEMVRDLKKVCFHEKHSLKISWVNTGTIMDNRSVKGTVGGAHLFALEEKI